MNNPARQDFGITLHTILSTQFNSLNKWYEKSVNRNRAEFDLFIDKVGVMYCSGYNDSFYPEAKVKLDLYKISEYNPAYKKIIKKIKKKDRFYVLDIKNFVEEHVLGVSAWDIDLVPWLIKNLIKKYEQK